MKYVDLKDYDVPGSSRGLLDVLRWRYLLSVLIRKGTSTRYRNSVLGWVWSYVKPGAQFAIYYFIVGLVLNVHRDMENFAVYLFSGIVVVNLFNEAFGNATNSIVDNRALVKKIYLPRELFPIAAIIGAIIHFLPQLAILVVVCVLVGWVPSVSALGAAVAAVALVSFFSLGLGLFFSGLNVRFRDAQNFVELIKMFSTWTSPVLYTWVLMADTLGGHPWLFFVYSANPLTVAVEFFHAAFWGPTTTDSLSYPPHFLASALTASALTIVVVLLGQLTFRKLEKTFAQDL